MSRKIRAGTQTLIQALQAIPWAEDQDNDDDVMHPEVTPTEPESDEDDKAGKQAQHSCCSWHTER